MEITWSHEPNSPNEHANLISGERNLNARTRSNQSIIINPSADFCIVKFDSTRLYNYAVFQHKQFTSFVDSDLCMSIYLITCRMLHKHIGIH